MSLFGLRSLEADTDYVKFFREGTRVPEDYQALQQGGFPQNPLSLWFTVPVGQSVLQPEYWDALDNFTSAVEQLSGVHSVLSPFLVARSAGLATNASSEIVAEITGPFDLFSADMEHVQLIVMTDYPSSTRLNELLNRIEPLVGQYMPATMQMTPTGTSLLWAHMDDGVIRTQKESLVIVCVVCLLILLVLFRSLKLAALGLAASLLPVGIVLGLMGFWGIPVNMATVLIAGIALGLAVDDTIHFIHAFNQATDRGLDRWTACEHAIVGVGLRMVVTTLILVGAFSVMGLSDFMPTSQFGYLTTLTIVLALFADLSLVPVLLRGVVAHPIARAPMALPPEQQT